MRLPKLFADNLIETKNKNSYNNVNDCKERCDTWRNTQLVWLLTTKQTR